MPNDWFQFKQFTVRQDLCAMKVSTDACIQGAWAAAWLSSSNNKPGLSILDIGTGTGLLSLMLAQSNPDSTIDAIEINEDAFRQAQMNFNASPWSGQLRVKHSSLRDFTHTAEPGGYDFIICNPPFFHNHLQSQDKARNNARHSVSLGKQELAQSASLLLSIQGLFCVLYPQTEWKEWLKAGAEAGLHPVVSLDIKPKAIADANRVAGIFAKKNNEHFSQETLVIYEADKKYTAAFRTLLQPYYLAL